jgi:AsmA protein
VSVKSVLKITGFVFALVLSSVIILALLVDANTFKPRIQALAAEHGVALNMRGDLHWAYWPSIGLAVNEVSIADNDAPQKIIADVKKASFLIAFVPLMRGDFQVKHVLVDGAVINLEVNEQGVGNWENILNKSHNDTADAAPASATETSAKELKLSIEKISLHNSQITYTDAVQGHRLALKNINVDMSDVNLNGAPFDVDFAWETQFTQTNASQSKTPTTPLSVQSKLHSSLLIGEGFNSLTLDKGELAMDIRAQNSASVKLTFAIKVDDLKNNLHYQGKLVVPHFNAKQLMAAFGVRHKTANEKALSEVNLTTDFSGDKKQIALNPLTIQLDKTKFSGSVAVKDFASQALVVDLQGDDINVDDYLAPPLPEAAVSGQGKTPVAAPVVTETGDEPLLPLPFLRKLNAQAKLALNTVVFSQMHLEKVLADVDAKQGVIQQNVNANMYSGSIHLNNKLDARGDNAQINFDAIMKGIQLSPLLKDKKLDKSLSLTGSLQANATGQTSGNTKNQLLNALTSTINFSGDQVRLAPLNVEQQFCKLVTMVTQQEAAQPTWNTYTELKKLSGKLSLSKKILTIESLSANVEKLLLGTNGSLNLNNGSYDFVLPLKLNRDANDTPTSITTSAQGCKVTSNYWVERSMTLLRCKGAYAQINPSQDCRPDKEQLNGLVKDFAAYKLKEKYGEKAESKKTELLKKLDEKLGGEGKAEQARDLLKNFFKKKNDK